MKKIIILSILFTSLAFAEETQIYVSRKNDEETVAKLFEITRRFDTSNSLGKWKQDMMKNFTLSCANNMKVITTKKNIIMSDEIYSPVLRAEDIKFLNQLNYKIGTYRLMDTKYCPIVSNYEAEELFKNCYLSNVMVGEGVLANQTYPQNYLVVDYTIKDGSKINVGVYCNMLSKDNKTKQFFSTKGVLRWTSPPKWQVVQFNGWKEKLMFGTTELLVDGLKDQMFISTIQK